MEDHSISLHPYIVMNSNHKLLYYCFRYTVECKLRRSFCWLHYSDSDSDMLNFYKIENKVFLELWCIVLSHLSEYLVQLEILTLGIVTRKWNVQKNCTVGQQFYQRLSEKCNWHIVFMVWLQLRHHGGGIPLSSQTRCRLLCFIFLHRYPPEIRLASPLAGSKYFVSEK